MDRWGNWCGRHKLTPQEAKEQFEQFCTANRSSGERRRKVNSQGYVVLGGYHEHPNASRTGAIAEHRLVMSMELGRPLVKGENVHHINGNRSDNRPENLELWNKTQPSGQRVQDKVKHALEILQLYAPEQLCQDANTAALGASALTTRSMDQSSV